MLCRLFHYNISTVENNLLYNKNLLMLSKYTWQGIKPGIQDFLDFWIHSLWIKIKVTRKSCQNYCKMLFATILCKIYNQSTSRKTFCCRYFPVYFCCRLYSGEYCAIFYCRFDNCSLQLEFQFKETVTIIMINLGSKVWIPAYFLLLVVNITKYLS